MLHFRLVPWNNANSSRFWHISTIASLLFTAASAYWGYLAHRPEFVTAVGRSDWLSRFVGWTLPLLPLAGAGINPAKDWMYRPTNPTAMAYGAIARICFSAVFMLLVYGLTLPDSIAIFVSIVILLGAALWIFLKARKIERGVGSSKAGSAG